MHMTLSVHACVHVEGTHLQDCAINHLADGNRNKRCNFAT